MQSTSFQCRVLFCTTFSFFFTIVVAETLGQSFENVKKGSVKKGSGTFVQSTLRAVPAKVPVPFLNPLESEGRVIEYASDVPSPILEASQVEIQPPEATQPPPARPPRPPRTPNRPPTNRRTQSRRTQTRLARLPYMFGDNSLAVFAFTGADDVSLRLPFYGMSEHMKMAENGAVVPGERTYFNYNHFHNALTTERGPPGAAPLFRSDIDINRYVIGWERLTGDGDASWEVRLPFTGNRNLALTPPGPGAPDLIVDAVSVGNLGLVRKRALVQTPNFGASAGVGVSVPTGEDLRVLLPGAARSVVIQNSAVHLLPFVGFASTDGTLFYQAFLQLDIDLNGNRVDTLNPVTGATSSGVLQNQAMLLADVSIGQWHLRDSAAPILTGIASVAELHYTTALENSDVVRSFGGAPTFQNTANRIDVLNVTVGTHLEVAGRNVVRIGAAFPLMDGNDRFFDAELLVQLVMRPF